ncbi:MAG TPA: DMT family transporter [Actinomycetota bacterium]|nr:DMT family transporter [Actinomycetota bacterium]
MRTARVITTSPGTRTEAFGLVEWSLLAGIGLMWGSSFIFVAEGLEAFEPGLVTLLRIALGTATVAIARRARRPVAREDWGRIAVLGLVWMAAPLLLFPIAQQWIDSSLAGMLNGAMPLFAALTAAVLLRRAPRTVQVIGLVLGFTGVIAIAWPAVQGASVTALGAALVILATVFYGIAANLTVPLQQKYGALAVVLRAQLVALLAVLPFGLAALPGSSFQWSSALAMVPLGVGGTGLAFLAMATLVGRAGATRGAVAIYFIPVEATLLGVIVRDESVQLLQLGGLVLVLTSAWLTSRRDR